MSDAPDTSSFFLWMGVALCIFLGTIASLLRSLWRGEPPLRVLKTALGRLFDLLSG